MTRNAGRGSTKFGKDIDMAEVQDCFTIAEPGLIFSMGGAAVANCARIREGVGA